MQTLEAPAPTENTGLVEISSTDLRQMAENFDISGEPPKSEIDSADPLATAPEEPKADGEPSQEVPKPSDEPKPTEDKAEQPKTRQDKERERRDRSWKALNEAKVEFKAQQEALTKERSELQALKTQNDLGPKPEQSTTPESESTPDATADDWMALAEDYDAEGRDDMATLAREKAAEARVSTRQTQPQVQPANQAAAQAEFNANLSRMVSENPDLSDHNSDLYKGVAEVFQTRPQFRQYAEGVVDAVQYVKSHLAASRVSDLEAELAEKESQIDTLNRKLTPSAGEAGVISQGEKSFEDMTSAEQAAFLRKQAVAIDAR
jgi:predicted RNase H-like nuclease (RuvC/YqgF family)